MRNNPIKQLSEQDLNRKQIKLQKIKDQMNPEHEAYRPGAQKKLAEKLHKTQYQVDTGQRGRPTSLRNEAWLAGTSRKSALNMLGVNKKEKPAKKEPELTEEEKKRLHAVSSINYDKVVSSGGVDLGTIRRKK